MDVTVPGGGKAKHAFERDGVYAAKCTEHGTRTKITVGDARITETIEQ